jgi:hypothetical protein
MMPLLRGLESLLVLVLLLSLAAVAGWRSCYCRPYSGLLHHTSDNQQIIEGITNYRIKRIIKPNQKQLSDKIIRPSKADVF